MWPRWTNSNGRYPCSATMSAMSRIISTFITHAARKLTRRAVNAWNQLVQQFARTAPTQQQRSRFARAIIVQSGKGSKVWPTGTDVVLTRSGTRHKWLRFGCPNGCGTMITLDLSPTRSPRWSVVLHAKGTISVYPSVVNKECGAHFIVRESRIIWL